MGGSNNSNDNNNNDDDDDAGAPAYEYFIAHNSLRYGTVEEDGWEDRRVDFADHTKEGRKMCPRTAYPDRF